MESTLDELHNILVGSWIGTPDIHSLNLNAAMCSIHVFIAINSLENELDSTVFCLLLYHIIGALLTNIINPVCDLLVTLLAACDASTKAVVVTDLPLGLGVMFWW